MIQLFGKNYRKDGLKIISGTFKTQEFYSQAVLLHLLQGSVEVTGAGDPLLLKGQKLMILKGREHAVLQSAEASTYLMIYSIPSQLLNSVANYNPYAFENAVIDESAGQGQKLLVQSNQILQYLREREGRLDFHLLSLALELIHLLTSHYMTKRSMKKDSDSRILDVLLYIEENYREAVTLEDIAAYFGVSGAYFSRYFKQQTGTGYIEYLTNYRLEAIAKQILSSNEKIAKIASAEGFTNLNSFNKKFKAKYSMTPREFKAQFKQEKDADRHDDGTIQELADIPERLIFTSDSQQIRVGAEGTLIPNNHPWNKILNIGSAQDLLQHDLRTHVTLLKNALDIEYLRFWNLFTKSMNFDPAVTVSYNFEKVDSVLDFLVAQGLKPFIELSYKVKRVHRSAREALIFEKEDFKFSLNSREWTDLLKQFMKHINERYGRRQVSKWRFEFSFGYTSGESELEELIEHYKRTYETIKQFTDAKIGGPGANVKPDFTADLKTMYQKKVSFDFISYMIYPYKDYEKGERNATQVEDENFLKKKALEIREAVSASPYKDSEIYITEWSNTISNRNIFNDSVQKGSYLLKNLTSVIGIVDAIAYWVGSDLFGEFIDSRDVLHGGAGLITKGGIIKPVFNAFRFLGFLRENIVYLDHQLIVTKNEDGEYSLLAFSFKKPDPSYYLVHEDQLDGKDFGKYFSDHSSLKIDLLLETSGTGKYEAKMFRVNEDSGNVIARWKDLGYRSSLVDKDMEYLKRGAEPKVNYFPVTGLNGELLISEELAPHEFIYMSITPLSE